MRIDTRVSEGGFKMNDVKWQLPVKQSNLTSTDWIHPRAKYHAFINHMSVCGQHDQRTDFFTTDLEQPLSKEIACHTCLKNLGLFTD